MNITKYNNIFVQYIFHWHTDKMSFSHTHWPSAQQEIIAHHIYDNV